MTWQLSSFAILALALAGGFAWYERTKPDARIIALVATLAAFAAIGRIAFAAFPNVKPTTDIVLIAGYALGGGPGFVVGAIAALTSNFFFGQGPWTPWQMAAWGLTGALGAGLALATRDRIPRWLLALVCAAAGFAFAAVQDVGDWVTYSDHSLRQLGVYVGSGIGFDVIDAVGCVVFALAFGPWLLRSIQRFARRLTVTWQPVGTTAAMLVVALVAVGQARAAPTPAGYLLAAQNQDGGFGGSRGQPSSDLFSGWAALGLAAIGDNPADVRNGGASLLAYIEAHPGTDPGSIERTMLVAGAAGVAATDFGGHDLVAELRHDFKPDGSVSDQTNLTSFAVLALRAVGLAPPPRMLGWLIRQQDSDGGFSFTTAGGGSDVDDTGAVLEALAGEPGAGHARARAVRFIRSQLNRDGGLPSLPGSTSNAQSTAWAVQGLVAAGADAAAALAYLSSLIAPDGHVRYSRGIDQSPVWVTAEALMALARKPLPLPAVARKAPAVHRAAPAHRHAVAGHPRRHARPKPPSHPTAAPADVSPLVADIVVVTALALALLGA
jgi:energy-coupling factor transport system substrate-specific component